MSSYGIASAYYNPTTAAYYDPKYQHYSALSKPNFSVSHLLDLEELPRENCAMYANTDMSVNNKPMSGLTAQQGGQGGMLLHTMPDRVAERLPDRPLAPAASPPLSPNKLTAINNNNNNSSSNLSSSCIHIKPNNTSLSPDLDKKSGE